MARRRSSTANAPTPRLAASCGTVATDEGNPEMTDPTTEIPRIFDADNHYWETSEAFTRHRDPKFNDRGLQVEEVDGVMRYVMNGEVFAFLPGPADHHPRPLPGAFMDYFK